MNEITILKDYLTWSHDMPKLRSASWAIQGFSQKVPFSKMGKQVWCTKMISVSPCSTSFVTTATRQHQICPKALSNLTIHSHTQRRRLDRDKPDFLSLTCSADFTTKWNLFGLIHLLWHQTHHFTHCQWRYISTSRWHWAKNDIICGRFLLASFWPYIR